MIENQGGWRWFFGLAALEAGAAFVILLALPHGGASISIARTLLLAILAVFCLAAIAFASRPPRWLSLLRRLSIAFALGLLSLLVAVALFLLRYLNPPALLPYYQRVSPLLWYVFVVCLQASLFLLYLQRGRHPDVLRRPAANWLPAAIAAGILLLVLVCVAITRIGLTPDSAYWGEPGVPLLGWQFALALIAGLALLIAGLRFPMTPRADWVIGLTIWLLAVLVWLSLPASLTRNSFYAPITPPSNQPYPNSDAGYYDSMAESLSIGQPYQGEIPTRPLYIVFLALLHLFSGENYSVLILAQTLVLALIPVLLYLLGRALHSRAAGLVAALFAIFREWTTILVSSQTRVSDSRTLLVDLPTLLLLLLACLFAVRWLARRDSRAALLAGGTFGLLLLLRSQTLLIVPVFLIVAWIALGTKHLGRAALLGLFLGAFFAAVTPWLIHNYARTGALTLDAPFQYQIIASQYQYTGNLDINNVDLQGKSVVGILATFLVRDPGFVLGFIGTHFLATEIDGLLALPLSEPYAGLAAPPNLYWLNWSGQLGFVNILLVVVYLLVIAVGLGAAWKRLHWAGLTPLVFSLAYSLANGIGRFSGWRYDLPADWVAFFYFAIGAAELLAWLAALFGARLERIFTEASPPAPPTVSTGSLLLSVAVFVLVGALPWLAEGAALPRYADQDRSRLVSAITTSAAFAQAGIPQEELASFMASPSSAVQSGRLLYPRFFPRDQGLASAHPWPAYAPRGFPRLGFLLLNQTRHDIVLPTRQLNGAFPHGSDIIVLGCQTSDYLDARLVYFPALDIIYAGTPLDLPCP